MSGLQAIKKIPIGLLRIWGENFGFFLIIFMLNFLPSLFDLLLNEDRSILLVKLATACVNIFFVSYLITLLRSFIKGKGQLVYAILVVTLLSFLFATECFTLYYYKSLINPSFVVVLFSTNKQEAVEFVTMYLTPANMLLCVAFLLLLAGCLYVSDKVRFTCTKRKLLSGSLLTLLLLLGGCVSGYALSRIQYIISYKVITPVERTLYAMNQARKDMEEFQRVSSKLLHKEPKILSNQSRIKNIVVILGESLSRTKMGCYGYELNTTPRMNERIRNGEAALFTDVVSPYTLTNEAVKYLMTFYDTQSDKVWYECDVLSEVMAAAGYTTYWISNQESFGIFGNLPASIASCSENVLFNKVRNSTEEKFGLFDEQLFPIIDKSMQEDKNKKFIVIHLMGSHTRYKNRYPYEFEHFTSDSIKSDHKQWAETIAEYNNTVLYNDFVVDNILKQLAGQETLVIYVSDHGEEVYDFRDLAGHPPTNVSRYAIEVPFIIWTSDLFKKQYPEKVKQIDEAVNRPYMTDDLPHTILDLAGIKSMSYDSTKSVVNSGFNSIRTRLVNGKIDYDKELKNKN